MDAVQELKRHRKLRQALSRIDRKLARLGRGLETRSFYRRREAELLTERIEALR